MSINEEHRLVRETARQFAQEQLLPFSGEWDKNAQYPHDAIKALGELGFMGMLVPAEFGGAQMDMTGYLLAIMEIAAGDASCSTIMAVNNSVVCMPLLRYGSAWQKTEFLTPLAQGKMLGAFCLTEPQAGSDASHLLTQAIIDGDHFILNGTKQFITSGKHGDIAIVFAATDKVLGKKGISAFIVPTNTPGYLVTHLEEKMGQKASDTAQIVLENCRIPKTHLLGELGQGYKIALSNLEGGRLGIAAQSIGIAKAALQIAVDYAKSRETFGALLCEHAVIRDYIADMATEIEAALSLLMSAALKYESGEAALSHASMAKLFSSQMAERVCSRALQILGGYGYLKDYRIEQLCRDVRVTQIYEGTSEVQKMVIARDILQK